jgi:RNA polymerase sigma factor (sigma-70 family)
LAFLRNISPQPQSDEELVAAYKDSGNLAVLGELYQRYMDLLYGVCLKYMKHPEDAQDCVINVFEELVEKLRKHPVENFRAWVYTVAKNHCLMRLRSGKKQVTVEFDSNLMQSEENLHLNGVLEKEENLSKMEHCLEKLTAEQKQAIELFYLKGKCYNEIADLTGLDWNKVRSVIQNGRRNLKICMETSKTTSALAK